MSVERIEFSLICGAEGDFPTPYPANKDVPDWYKAMPVEVEAEGVTEGSVKNCPPFLEALTCGYIVPLADDMAITLDKDGRLYGQSPSFRDDTIVPRSSHMFQAHKPVQVKGSPMENFPILKIFNPWLIRTSPGYSTLFMAPLNRFQMSLYPLAGLVETDAFYREVSFTSVLTIARGTTVKFPRGMPFVQAIPIKRDEFQSGVVPLDAIEYKDVVHNSLASNKDYYKHLFWKRKSYR
jgi:hypothetical protein